MRKRIVLMIARLLCVDIRHLVRRRFYHREGFGDDTHYITWYNGVTHCVSNSGKWTKSHHALWWLRDAVRDNRYREEIE